MELKLKKAENFLLFILSAAIPAFYLFLKTNKFASLNTDSLQVLKDTLLLFLFFIGIFLNRIIKKKIINFIVLLMLSSVSFLLLPESVLLFSPILILLWSRPLIKEEEPKSLYVFAFYAQSVFLAVGLYLFKTRFFISFFEHGEEYRSTFLLIISVISLCFVPLFIIVFVYEKKKSRSKSGTIKTKPKVGFKIELFYLTEVLLVFVSFLFFSFSHHFSFDLLWLSVITWFAVALIFLFDKNARLKSILTKKKFI